MCTNVPVFRFRRKKAERSFSGESHENSGKEALKIMIPFGHCINDFHKIATVFIKFVYGPHLIPKLY